MRRPPIACRGAVQTLQPSPSQHIWICEKLLAQTFDRFLRTTCRNQHRHGSHVPGPLEARRRAAKRRMTVSANFYPQDSFPSLFNLSALFGFRSKSQPSWRYEPPTPRAEPEPLATCTSDSITESSTRLSTVSGPASPNPVSPPLLKVGDALGAQQDWRMHDGSTKVSAVSEATNSSEDSDTSLFTGVKPAFEAFQARVAEVHQLEQREQDTVLREAFQECCPISELWMYTTRVFRHVLHLGLNPRAILSHQAASDYAVPSIDTEESLDILVCLERFMQQYPSCVRDIHRIHVQLAKCAEAVGPSHAYKERRVLKLIQQLWMSAHLQGLGRSRPTLDLLFSVANSCNNTTCRATLTTVFGDITLLDTALAKLITDLRDQPDLMVSAIDIVSCIPHQILLQSAQRLSTDFAEGALQGSGSRRIEQMKLFHVWLLLLHRLKASNAQSGHHLVDTAFATIVKLSFFSRSFNRNAPLLLSTCLVIASQDSAYKHVPLRKISASLQAYFAELSKHDGSLSFEVASGVFMSNLRARTLPPQLVVQMIVDSLVRYASFEAVRDFCNVLERRGFALIDPTSVHARISHQLGIIEKSTDASSHDVEILVTCQQILQSLSRISTIPGDLKVWLERILAERRFKAILDSARALRLLPLRYRDIGANVPVEEHNILVHQIAHQYSTHTELSHQEAWRAVYRLYRYLQQQSLPIGPLFSKAVVRVSITRPLMDNQFVSARRLIWVYHLVEKVEGEDVAKRLEALFWIWRGELIKHAKSVHDGTGANRQQKAHIGTMRKLGLL